MKFVIGVVAALLVTPLAAHAQQGPSAKPNVVLIITDDVGYGDLRQLRRARRQDAEHRSPGAGRRAVHRLLRRAHVHADPRGADHGPLLPAHGHSSVRWAPHSADAERGLPATGPFAAATDEERRLRHRASSASGTSATSRSSAEGARLRLLLRVPERTAWTTTSTRTRTGNHDLFENDKPVHVDGYMTDLITERVGEVHRTERAAAVLPRGGLQRRALAVPGAGQAVGGAGQRAVRAAARGRTRARAHDYAAILERADQGVGPASSPRCSGAA